MMLVKSLNQPSFDDQTTRNACPDLDIVYSYVVVIVLRQESVPQNQAPCTA